MSSQSRFNNKMERYTATEQKLRKRKIREDTSDSETNDEGENITLSELRIKLGEEQISGSDWKNRFDEDDLLSKTLSPSAQSSDTSSVHSGRFDSEFSVGQRIEVKDYRTDTWYSAKIMEVDYDDKEIFIHYERWSVRFDEWLKWDSQRIRKVRLPPSHHRFKVGEHVLATWSYTKKYPAAVKTVLPDDKYEVLFFDGFVKILRGNRIAKIDPRQTDLLEKMPKEIPRAPPIGTDLDVRNIGTKEERRQKKRRLNVVELLQPGKRKRVDEILQSATVSSDTSPEMPLRRRRRRQQSHSSSSGTLALRKNEDHTNTSDDYQCGIRNTTVVDDMGSVRKKEIAKYNEPGEKENQKDIRDETDSSKCFETNNIIKENDDEEDVKGSDVAAPTESMGDSPNDMEKDKDSNSEQEFTGFDTPSLTIKPGDYGNDNDDEMSEQDNYSPSTSLDVMSTDTSMATIVTSPVLSNLPSQGIRRISKRGRIPKLKTSLGNLGTTPRLSAFPKIKPRGRIFKPNEHGSGKARGRMGKNHKKSANVDSDDAENDSPKQSSINVLPIEKLKNKTDVGVPSLSENDDELKQKERNLINERNINNDLLMISSGSSISSNLISGSLASSSPDVNSDNMFNQDASPQIGIGSDSVPKKGRRLKKSLKKGDEKKGKSLKMANRRKADEDDDPERWNGDIPEGAKPVFIDGGDGKMRQSIIIPDKKLPPGWTKHTIIRKNSSKWDVLLVNPNGRKFRSRKDLRTYYNELNKDYPEDCFDFVVGRTKMTSNLIEMETIAKKQGLSPPSMKVHNKKRESKKSGSDDGGFSSVSPSHTVVHEGEKRVKTLMPKTKPPVVNDDELIVSASAATAAVSAVTTNVNVNNVTSGTLVPLLQQHGTLNKPVPVTPTTPKLPIDMASISSVSNNSTPDADGTASWICPKEGCGKHFRKENLLQMHIKHYHPEYNQFLDSAPNVADLAYARTVGEPLDETVGAASFLDKISKYEAKRKAKADGSSGTKSDIVASLPKKNIVYSPLRKALMKGLPSKDSSDYGDELGDYITKTDPLSTGVQSKYLDGLDHTDFGDGDSEKYPGDNERGKLHSTEDNSNDHISTGGHSTLKELLSGTGSLDESAPNSPVTPSGITRASSTNLLYRFSRNKPLVTLEKLNLTTDSNGRVLLDKNENDSTKLSEKMSDSVPDINDHELSADISNCTEVEPEDLLKKEEIINCLCGYAEEDGLMIQCDLCLCWQHGFCNNINQESDVPEKYICCICRNPKKLRNSYKYTYNFDWLKEGKLPTLSFRNKNKNEIQQRESLLKRSHDLVSNLLQLQKVVKSLRLKTHIAGKSDHPKLYLWAKSWEKETKSDVKSNKSNDREADTKVEDIKKEPDSVDGNEEDEKDKPPTVEDISVKGPQIPVPEAPIDLVECRLRLLEHIEDYQLQVESRLTTLESQVVALESQDPDLASDETPDFYPQTKQTVQMLMRDLMTVRKVIGLN